MNKRKKEIIVKNIELTNILWWEFEKYLKKQDLDIEYVLYEDPPKYFDRIWVPFYNSFLKKMNKK